MPIANGFDESEPCPLTLEQVHSIVKQMGLLDAIEVFVSHVSIEDKELAKWWEMAELSIHKIRRRMRQVG